MRSAIELGPVNEQTYLSKCISSFTTRRKFPLICCLTRKQTLPLLCLCTLVGLALTTMPIGWTPLSLIIKHRTWQSVNAVHIVRILLKSPPQDVRPLSSCSRCFDPAPRSDIDFAEVRFYEDIRARIRETSLQGTLQQDILIFAPIMNKEIKSSLLYTYHVMAQALQAAGVQHVILHGTLLGIHRFSGVQPWDDDIDVGVNVSQWQKVRTVLSCIDGFELMVDPCMRWSFFASSANRSEIMAPKKYPFVDIFFYSEDETHVWGLNSINRHRSLFPKSEMFPYRRAKMDDLNVPVPYDTPAILTRQYGDLDVCATQEIQHFRYSPMYETVVRVPCSRLFLLYGPFGNRSGSHELE